MENFTPISALVGGMIIGVAASLLWIFNGRVAGVSGVVGALFSPRTTAIGWRLSFVAGLVGGGFLLVAMAPGAISALVPRSPIALVIAGLCVGVGSRLGGGCTSGHGVCGISRLSLRSMVATVVFIVTGAVTVAIYQQVTA